MRASFNDLLNLSWAVLQNILTPFFIRGDIVGSTESFIVQLDGYDIGTATEETNMRRRSWILWLLAAELTACIIASFNFLTQPPDSTFN